MSNFQISISGVTPGTYGGVNQIPCIKLDKTGRVTFADNVPIDVKAALDQIQEPLNNDIVGNVQGNVTGNITGVVTALAGSSFVGNVVGNTTGLHNGDVRGSLLGKFNQPIFDIEEDKIRGNIISESINLVGPKAGFAFESNLSQNDDQDFARVQNATDDSEGQAVLIIRSRGTNENPTSVQSGDNFLTTAYLGHDGTTYRPSVLVIAGTSGTIRDQVVPGTYKIDIITDDARRVTAFGIDERAKIRVADNTVNADQVNVAAGAVGYLKINIEGTDYAFPYYNLN